MLVTERYGIEHGDPDDVTRPFVTSVVFLDLPLSPIENEDETNRPAEESSYGIKRLDDKRFRRCY